MTRSPIRPDRRRLAIRILLGIGVALAAFVVAFDWNWVKPSVERALSEHSHRSVRIDDFRVSFSWSLDPTFHLRGVHIQNAPWADARPFIEARELVAHCSLSSLIEKRPVITRLLLVDADIDLERQADGLRNWRLTRPEDRGPGVIRIFAVEPVRSRIRFVHRGLGLDVQTAASPADAAASAGAASVAAPPSGQSVSTPAGAGSADGAAAAAPGPAASASAVASMPLTTRVDFEGRYRDTPFSGSALTGHELTLQGTDGRLFPLRGHAESAGARLEVDGLVADVLRMATIDAHAMVRATSAAKLPFLVGRKLDDSPPLAVVGQVTKHGTRLALDAATARIGSTVIEGNASLDIADARTVLRAALQSPTMRVDDLRWVRSLGRPVERVALTEPPTGDASPVTGAPTREVDAEVGLKVARLMLASMPAVGPIELKATMQKGVVTVAPFETALGGGRAQGRFTLDTTMAPPEAQVRLDVADVRLEKMLPPAPDDKRIAGGLVASLDMAARGKTFAELVATAEGSLNAVVRGGSMSPRLDAELGLSGSRFIRSLFAGGERVPLRCIAADLEVHAGKGRSRRLMLQTEHTHVEGLGRFDLASGAFDVVLTPSPARPGLLELRRSISVRRADGKVSVGLADLQPMPVGPGCVEQKP